VPDSYPYIISNNKIDPILSRIRSAAKPDRFSRDTLAKWGFPASNDRAIISVLKELGFLNEGGAPTPFYDRLRDPNDWKYVLGERIRELYAELFAIDGNIQAAPENETRGAISRVTGKDDESAKRYSATFRTLTSLASFDPKPARAGKPDKSAPEEPLVRKPTPEIDDQSRRAHARPDFHYNIQIHLPVTTDISVYNAIFKSLKDNLGV
jgi:hypothetical protein